MRPGFYYGSIWHISGDLATFPAKVDNDRRAAERPVKRKSGKNKCWPLRPGPGRPKTFS